MRTLCLQKSFLDYLNDFIAEKKIEKFHILRKKLFENQHT